MQSLKTRIALTALTLLTGWASHNSAHAGTLLDMQIISRSTGLPLQVYRYRGQQFVIGIPGERYSIRLANQTAGRVLGVLSVDGVNAISGETASASQSGYVLGPYEAAEITGWRKSMEEVARFYFARLPESYAARTGRPDNVGVIGVAAYTEYVAPPPATRTPDQRYDNAAREAAPASSGRTIDGGTTREQEASAKLKAEGRLGTGHGERETAPTRYTEFQRATPQPREIIAIRYDSRAQLVSQGIIPEAPPRLPDPQPFPGNFVPDPQG